MNRFLTTLLLSTFALSAHAADASSDNFSGLWRYDATLSTELSPWKAFDLTLTVQGEKITIHRQLSWSRRIHEDTTVIDLAQTGNVQLAPMWADNRHLGAYISDDRTKRVRAEWLDEKRILRVNTDLTLEAQQGPRAVNILSDYKLSTNGSRLTLTELRSTRNRPIVYIFNRVSPTTAP
ncbi:hypothetical protein CMV30_11915 [Nibricoccus aquaticus]|uniref:Lipocalin-like domain-containing protein n=1 Tax=Nibricoccus aquaticus TaxID=2576891 RepID=A0A290Q7X3_9BACT|nr:hypothetical protein [Nibricoccus aquaticus]ATC64604.1 hypothetical protein CMV30_11915 [Nibricoccus aquaticus]